mmetsp:Transcript_23799/g.68889  ORF Transcript_23799/g.68889 Transcript_23799/m.68889 type:complete len:496 (+) Transcript_23799:69-1556(+)
MAAACTLSDISSNEQVVEEAKRGTPGADEDSNSTPAASASLWEVGCRLRPLVLLMGLLALQSGVLAPSVIYVSTSFFAGTGSNCSANPSSEACKRGAAELAYWKGILKAVTISISWISAVAFGSLSDRIGRRPLYRIKALLSGLPVAMLTLHEFGGVSFWGYLVVDTIVDSFEIGGVYVATAADLVTEPSLRAAAFATLMGSLLVMRGVVLLISLVPGRVALMMAIAATGMVILYVEAVLPETGKLSAASGASRRTRCAKQARRAACVLLRNSFVFRTAIIIAASWFALSGVRVLIVPISTGYLGVTKNQGIGLAFVTGASMFLGTAMTKPLTGLCGETRALRFSLLAAVLYPIAVASSRSLGPLAVFSFVLSGPMIIMMPVVAAMKSNLFGEDEQGLVQGALTSIRVVASALAEFFFGWLYRHTTDRGEAPHDAVWVPLLTGSTLFAVALLIALGLPHKLPAPPRPPQPPKSQTQSSESSPSCNEDAEVGARGK